jgi:hypothetical protein
VILLQLCIHRTRIAQQRKKSKSGISLSKTIKRQAFNKDRKLRLTSTTDPHGRKSTSPIDFSLPPRSPPSTSSAASGSVVVNDAVTKQTVVRVGGQVVTLSADLGLEQAVEGVSIETAGSASDASDDDNSVHTAGENLSEGDDSDKGEQDNEAAAPFEQRVDGKTTRDSSPPAAAVQGAASPHAAAPGGCAAGEGWDNLSPFGDVDAAAAAKDGGSGEGRIGLLPLDGLMFCDAPMYELHPAS